MTLYASQVADETMILTDKYLITFIKGRLLAKVVPTRIPTRLWKEVHLHSILITKGSLHTEYAKYTDGMVIESQVDLTGNKELTDRLLSAMNATLTIETPNYMQLIGIAEVEKGVR